LAYAYDPLNRLTAARGPWGSQSFTYDANGNRLSESLNDAAYRYAYEGNRLMSVSPGNVLKYHYDRNGNPLSDGSLDYAYSQNNRLSSVFKCGRVLAQYVYNGKGQRVVKTAVSDDDRCGDRDGSGVQYTIFHYDLSGRLIEETSEKRMLLTDYVYLGRKPLAMVKNTGDPGGKLLLR
jgi:YD repeat-containing protein